MEREKEIQRYIGVYLSAVVIVFSWMIGPQSKLLNEMVLGNNGYNIYAFLMVSVVNALFMTFPIYKSLDVHDTTQFITVLAKPTSVYTFWESWRRSERSVTKPVRTLYFVALTLLPTMMAFMLLLLAGCKLLAREQVLRDQLVEIQRARLEARSTSTVDDISTQSSSPTPSPTSVEVSAQLVPIQSAFRGAKYFFGLVILHFVPIWFFFHNTVHTKRKWKAIVELKEAQAKKVLPGSSEASSEALVLADLIEYKPAVHQVDGNKKTIAEVCFPR